MSPFMAHKHFGDTYRWILLGEMTSVMDAR